MNALTPLQKLEVFHLLFLREMVRTVALSAFVLKGGTNLRFFFGSIRYSEDMDLDASGLAVHVLQEKVMRLLRSSGFTDSLKTFGIEDLRLPQMARAKPTEAVQRFKIGLLSSGGEDLPTTVEFSRRGLDVGVRFEPVAAEILAAYRMPPVIVPHYGAHSAAMQKVLALFSRALPQARDIFDLYLLSSQPEVLEVGLVHGLAPESIQRARDRIDSIGYRQYRDTVVDFLGPEDRAAHDSPSVWDEIRLRVLGMFEGNVHDGSQG